MDVAIFVIATGRYIGYAEKLCIGINKYFLPNHSKKIYLFTDSDITPTCTTRIFHEHKPWPYPTLYRYNIIYDFCLKNNIKHDVYYYLDADMDIVDYVGDEIIGDIVATIHPGFYNKKDLYYETMFMSHAYINPNKITNYYAGGFNGGVKYLEIARVIKKWNDMDQQHGFTPKWHDETYLNKYLALNNPDVILTPDYCMPETDEERKRYGIIGMKPKIIAITKHKK